MHDDLICLVLVVVISSDIGNYRTFTRNPQRSFIVAGVDVWMPQYHWSDPVGYNENYGAQAGIQGGDK